MTDRVEEIKWQQICVALIPHYYLYWVSAVVPGWFVCAREKKLSLSNPVLFTFWYILETLLVFLVRNPCVL